MQNYCMIPALKFLTVFLVCVVSGQYALVTDSLVSDSAAGLRARDFALSLAEFGKCSLLVVTGDTQIDAALVSELQLAGVNTFTIADASTAKTVVLETDSKTVFVQSDTLLADLLDSGVELVAIAEYAQSERIRRLARAQYFLSTDERVPNITADTENKLLLQASAVVAASDADRAILAAQMPEEARARLHTVHFTHDIAQLLGSTAKTSSFASRSGLVFVGSGLGDRVALRWFFEAVYPDLRRRLQSNVAITVVGLAELVSAPPNVRFIDNNNNNELRAALDSARVMIAPFFQTGVATSALLGMAAGLPVVTTSFGAQSLTNANASSPLVVADNAELFASHIIQLLESESVWAVASLTGQHFAHSLADRSQLRQEIEAVLRAVRPSRTQTQTKTQAHTQTQAQTQRDAAHDYEQWLKNPQIAIQMSSGTGTNVDCFNTTLSHCADCGSAYGCLSCVPFYYLDGNMECQPCDSTTTSYPDCAVASPEQATLSPGGIAGVTIAVTFVVVFAIVLLAFLVRRGWKPACPCLARPPPLNTLEMGQAEKGTAWIRGTPSTLPSWAADLQAELIKRGFSVILALTYPPGLAAPKCVFSADPDVRHLALLYPKASFVVLYIQDPAPRVDSPSRAVNSVARALQEIGLGPLSPESKVAGPSTGETKTAAPAAGQTTAILPKDAAGVDYRTTLIATGGFEEGSGRPIVHFYERDAPYYEFANFWECPIKLDGHTWTTSEHYFQAQKFTEPIAQEEIRVQPTPRDAFNAARRYDQLKRADWNAVKDEVMHKVVREKFTQHDYLRNLLLLTGNAKLVEHTVNDSYWGDGGDGRGRNMLGQTLERVRDEIRGEMASRKA